MKHNLITKSLLAALTAACALSPFTAQAAPAKGGPDIEAILALVPESDPAATEDIQVLTDKRGVHPRLIMTEAQYAALKPEISRNPILDENFKRVKAIANGFTAPQGPKAKLVMSDTPALATAGGGYPNLVVAYGIDGDSRIKQNIIDLLKYYVSEDHWSYSKELDSSMGAGNNMLVAGLAFDAVADELDPEFRMEVAQKLLTQVRRLYYLGHEKRNKSVLHYWQQDPANNHRWHRAAGMAACLLSIRDIEGIETDYIMQQFKAEMDFLIKWFPEEGDCHEGSGYQVFGLHFITMAAMMMDNVIGTNYLDAPGFRNAWMQQVYATVPGAKKHMSFGDSTNAENKMGHYGSAFFYGPALSRNADAQAAMADRYRFLTTDNAGNAPFTYPWMALVYYDPTLQEGDINNLPTYYLMSDMGAAFIRDTWEDDAVLLMFKCGPYGGYKLNQYRNENDFHYVNIAHDDPDANTFALAMDSESIVDAGVYFSMKKTENHNTILVNGKGQIGENTQYTQPVKNTDMTTLSYLTSWKTDNNRIIIEGEAGNAYPKLKQFRRSVIWLPGDYILMLDNVVADGKQDITWQMNTEKAEITDADAGKGYISSQKGDKLNYQMLSNQKIDGSIEDYQFKGRWGKLDMDQTQFDTKSDAVQFACLFDPWKRGDLKLTFTENDGYVTLTVKGYGVNDTWNWKPSADLDTPSLIKGTRDGQNLIYLTAEDKAPRGHQAQIANAH